MQTRKGLFRCHDPCDGRREGKLFLPDGQIEDRKSKEDTVMKEFRKRVVTGLVVTMLMAIAVSGFCATADITGTVEQKGEIVILFTPDDTYVLKGNELLPRMIGKKVTVTGEIEEKDMVKVITVTSFEEVEE
jgi:hypothetical protein